jgi:hypothetical protein
MRRMLEREAVMEKDHVGVQECGSVVQGLLIMHKALGLIPGTKIKKKGHTSSSAESLKGPKPEYNLDGDGRWIGECQAWKQRDQLGG